MKKFISLLVAFVLCIGLVAFAEGNTTNVTTLPTGALYGDLTLALNTANVKEHVYAYDVTIDYSAASFEYTYSGEYKVDPNNPDKVDFSGVTGEWADNEASVTVTCNAGSDAIKVWVYCDAEDGAIINETTGETAVTFTINNPTTKTAPALLNGGDSLVVTYTAEGDMPYGYTYKMPSGQTLGRYIADDGTVWFGDNADLGVSVFITDEYGNFDKY